MSWKADIVFNSGEEFVAWLNRHYKNTVKNNINSVHVHHTWRPNHSNKESTLQLHKNMRNYHVNTNKWSDIAQHVSIGKDGKVVLGRHITKSPASASGYNGSANWHPFMFEMIGDFDVGRDKLEGKQLESVLAICHYIHVTHGKPIKFHREMSSKSCPGSGIDKAKFVQQVKNYKSGETNNVSTTKPSNKTSTKNTTKSTSKTNTKSKWVKVTGRWNGSPVLRKWHYGKPVEQLQIKLRNKGYLKPHQVDGYFGDITEEAVKRAQKDGKITVDGLAGSQTYKVLSSNNSKTASKKVKYPLPSGILRKGSKGESVRQLQRALNAANFKCGKVDGIYGSLTEDAVRRFQKVYDPNCVDGVYGPRTRQRLDRVVNK